MAIAYHAFLQRDDLADLTAAQRQHGDHEYRADQHRDEPTLTVGGLRVQRYDEERTE